MMTTTTTRTETIAEADRKRAMADKAHREGHAALRDAFLTQAADRYRAAGLGGMAAFCDRFKGTPAR